MVRSTFPSFLEARFFILQVLTFVLSLGFIWLPNFLAQNWNLPWIFYHLSWINFLKSTRCVFILIMLVDLLRQRVNVLRFYLQIHFLYDFDMLMIFAFTSLSREIWRLRGLNPFLFDNNITFLIDFFIQKLDLFRSYINLK